MLTFILFLVILIVFPAFRYFVLLTAGVLGMVYVCMEFPLAIPFLVCGITLMIWHVWKKAQQEDAVWEANQKERCEGYHPNNGWEYIENPDTDR
ncbi:MAG: hypothetical protein Q4D98_03020 [Planctomycetia bacterium]|nr:hypothetical protein [Planctomycetia bacterium]